MDDERFFAWLDGELDPQAAADVEARVAADPALQRKAAAHRSMQARLGAAFDPIASSAPQAGQPLDLAAARERKAARRAWPSMAQWAAMAATLVLGLAAGSMMSDGVASPDRNDAGQLIASGPLDRALDARLASVPMSTGPRIGLTFRDRAGSICRSFTDGTAQGLARREGEHWALRALIQGPAAQSGDYRMAAGVDPAIAALVDERIAGEPFDAEAERKAQAGGWR